MQTLWFNACGEPVYRRFERSSTDARINHRDSAVTHFYDGSPRGDASVRSALASGDLSGVDYTPRPDTAVDVDRHGRRPVMKKNSNRDGQTSLNLGRGDGDCPSGCQLVETGIGGKTRLRSSRPTPPRFRLLRSPARPRRIWKSTPVDGFPRPRERGWVLFPWCAVTRRGSLGFLAESQGAVPWR